MKIKVKNLAKIKHAEIELKPLTIFVGKNATQKSYMAHVIYETAKFFKNFTQRFYNPLLAFSGDSNLIQYLIQFADKEITKNKSKKIESWIIEREYVKDIMFRVFSEFNEIITKSIINSLNTKNKFRNFSVEVGVDFDKKILREIEIPMKVHTNFLMQILEEDIKRRYSNQLLKLFSEINPFLKKILKTNMLMMKDVFYFPASRTGFVLAFDEMIAGIISERYVGKKTTAKLTQPIIDFLLNFLHIKTNKLSPLNISTQLQDLILFLRERILHGIIVEENEESKYLKFYFQPSHTRKKLEMHVVSSSTIELLPIVEFLKSFKTLKGNLLIIEEPEAHLHPEAQIEMARFLTLLVNKGANVLITTHSDYIIHEISNCIKLSNISEEERINYLKKKKLEKFPEIAISEDKVGVYLFKEMKTKTKVERMKIDKFGIEDKNFEDVLDELLEDTNILGEYLID